MANRYINDNRTVTQSIPDESQSLFESLAPKVAEIGQDIIRKSQEAKIVENLSSAQLELGKLSNDFQIQYEGDPFNEQGIKDFRNQRQGILDKYGEGISPLFGRAWKDNAAKLASSNDLSVSAWGYKQAHVNTIQSINTSIKNNLEGAYGDGSAFASGSISEAEALLKFEGSYTPLKDYGDTNLGSTSTAKVLEDYRGDYMLNFISGVSDSNPYKAKKILDNEQFNNDISLVDRKRLEGHIEGKIEKLEKIAAADQSLKQTDPAGWGERHGLSVEQIAGMQSENGFVDIIGNKKAKDYAAVIKAQDNPDSVVNFAEQIKTEYGGYADNALQKIATNLPVDTASALNIAINSDPEYYAEQFSTLVDLSRYNDKKLDDEYKATLFDGDIKKPSDIEEEVVKNTDVSRHAVAMREEGDGSGAFPYINQTSRLAKLYRIKNPTKTVDESIAFANKYTSDKYFFAKNNGVEYRVPTQLPDGTGLSPVYVDKIESHLEDALPKIDMKVNGKDIKRREDVTPFLNPGKDGLWFRSPENVLILNSENAPSEIKFKELLNLTPAEKTKLEQKRKVNEIEKLPYGERDAARKKAFQ